MCQIRGKDIHADQAVSDSFDLPIVLSSGNNHV